MRSVALAFALASVWGLVLVSGCTSEPQARQSTPRGPAGTPQAAAVPRDALSNLHHPVATSNAEAQRRFDEGLTQVYAFNHDEAIRCFKRALEADPNLAMAHWGIALALGPNYNVDVDAEREKQAYEEIHKAMELAKDGPQPEKDYIATLARRFSNAENPDLKALANDYAAAARDLSAKYPDDLDAAALAAEAMMDLRPWKLWTKDYKPAEGTEQIVAILESVLKRDPDHIGANHLYIHAVEASSNPHRALESAARLPTLAPSCGHLVHMPSHIYARVGDHESAATSNEAAIAADRDFFAKHPEGKGGMYEMMYYPHNMHFCTYAESFQGNHEATKKWAQQLYMHAQPHVQHMPMLEGFTDVPVQLEVKFRRWDDILKADITDEKTMPITTAMWHFARGMAYAGKGDMPGAQSEREKFVAISQKLPPDAMHGMLNKASAVLSIAQHTLDAKIASSQKNWSEAAAQLREAVKMEDELVYMEPPDWLMPVRESLGGVLLQSGDAVGAEKAFRQSLADVPRNGRALFGLWKSLEAQGRTYDAEQVRRQFETAWKQADTKLRVEDL
jgi:tetratricopeptide (TPR) repeat protein